MSKNTKIQNIKDVFSKAYNLQPKQELKQKKYVASEIFAEYCSNSSIQGLRYIGDPENTWPEKILWLLVFSLSVMGCSYLIAKTWLKWDESPVILTFENVQTSIVEIPFPAVTICPIKNIIQTKYNYTDKFLNRNNLPENDHKTFCDVSLLCKLEKFNQDFNCSYNVTDERIVSTFINSGPTIEETIMELKWNNQPEGLELFAEHITEEGICFTFNSFSNDDMYTDKITKSIKYINHSVKNTGYTMEDGYNTTIDESDWPRRSANDGYYSGLSFCLVSYAYNIDYVCGLPISGYKIILHHPTETPSTTQQYIFVPSDQFMTVIIQPKLTMTSESLRSMSPKVRKCYFSNERTLKFFKVYNQNNCRIECKTKVIKKYCDCVPFYLPRDGFSTPVCGFQKTKCVRDIEDPNIHSEEEIQAMYDKCNCLPTCMNLQYDVETSQTKDFTTQAFLDAGIINNQSKNYLMYKSDLTSNRVHIFFKETQFLALRRNELYGQTDFLANCGGLLGLFMGFSIVSLIEIFYYLTIHLWFKYKVGLKKKIVAPSPIKK